MSLTPEEQVALDYQITQRQRLVARRGLQAKLKAPSEPAATTKRNWAPVTKTGYIKGQAE